jgi:hypothetical protein
MNKYQDDRETISNGMRLINVGAANGYEVSVFMPGEGMNGDLFSGDNGAMKELVSHIVDLHKKLECEYLLLPE